MSGDASRPGSRRRRSARTFRTRLPAATLLPGALVAALAGLGYEDVYRVAEPEEAQGVLAATTILMADRVDPADAAALASAAQEGRPADPERVDRVRRELWRQRTVVARSFDAVDDDPEERLVERTLVDVRLVAPTDASDRGVVALSQDGRRIGDLVDLSAGGRPGPARRRWRSRPGPRRTRAGARGRPTPRCGTGPETWAPSSRSRRRPRHRSATRRARLRSRLSRGASSAGCSGRRSRSSAASSR